MTRTRLDRRVDGRAGLPAPRTAALVRQRERGRTMRLTATATALGVLTSGLAWWWAGPERPTHCEVDALTASSTSMLRDFGAWLSASGATGVIGEVGWPQGGADGGEWQRLAARWLDVADDPEVNVGVYVWAAGQQWRPDYRLAVYRSSGWASDRGVLDTGSPIGSILESHLPSTLPHGIGIADGAFGSSFEDGAGYSALSPGRIGADYRYPSRESLRFLRERDIRDLRLAFTWERVQPEPFGPLRDSEVRLIADVLDDAADLGQSVVLDLHNFGRFMDGSGEALVLGSEELPGAALADLWSRLAEALGGRAGVGAYGIMNEPHGMPGGARAWERISADTVRAIRERDPSTTVLVGGYSWSSIERWTQHHPSPWIDDAAVVYEGHHYIDTDRRGVYPRSYADENAAAEASGWGPCGRVPADAEAMPSS